MGRPGHSSPDGVVGAVTLKTAPMQQWTVAREMRERIKARFDHEGIEMPFPQRVIWHADRAGRARTRLSRARLSTRTHSG